MVNRIQAPGFSQARRDATSQILQQIAQSQDIQAQPMRNRLMDLQAQQRQQELELAPRREARADQGLDLRRRELGLRQQQESRQQSIFESEDEKRRAAVFIQAAPLLNAEAKRVRALESEDERRTEITRFKPVLDQLGLSEGLNLDDVSNEALDQAISITDSVLTQTGRDSLSPIEAIDPQTGKIMYYQPSKKGGATPLGLEVPKKSAQIKLEAEQLEEKNKKAERMEKNRRDAAIVGFDIDRALNQSAGVFSTGFTGAISSAVPGTSAHDLKQTLNAIRSNVGFNKLQEMREASPTGGALGSISNEENKLLQSVLGSLEQSQSDEQLQYNLGRLRILFDAIVNGTNPIPFTQEDYDALPSGTDYISPDTGTVHRKP